MSVGYEREGRDFMTVVVFIVYCLLEKEQNSINKVKQELDIHKSSDLMLLYLAKCSVALHSSSNYRAFGQ